MAQLSTGFARLRHEGLVNVLTQLPLGSGSALALHPPSYGCSGGHTSGLRKEVSTVGLAL